MRVVVIVESFPRSTEAFLRDHIEALGADAFAVHASDLCIASNDWSRRPYVASLHKDGQEIRRLGQRIQARIGEELFGLPRPARPKGMETLWAESVRERVPDVALAEFGPNAICALSACRRDAVFQNGVNSIMVPLEDDDEVFSERAARELAPFVTEPLRLGPLTEMIRDIRQRILWTWDERLEAELSVIRQLVEVRAA